MGIGTNNYLNLGPMQLTDDVVGDVVSSWAGKWSQNSGCRGTSSRIGSSKGNGCFQKTPWHGLNLRGSPE